MAARVYGLVFGLILANVALARPSVEGQAPKSLEEYKSLQDLQNVYVRKYLNEYEEMQKNIQDEKEKDALEEVKLLVIQSWIYTLKPHFDIFKDMFMNEKITNIEEATEEIKREIKNMDKQLPVKDAIMVYVGDAEKHMKKDLEKRIAELKAIVNSKSRQLEFERDENKSKQLLNEKLETNTKLEELTFYAGFHKIARRMCLQSYILDFAESKEGEKFVIESSDGKKKEFFMPPLREGDFWSFVKETEITRNLAKVV